MRQALERFKQATVPRVRKVVAKCIQQQRRHRHGAPEIFTDRRPQQRIGIEDFLGIVLDQHARQFSRRHAVGQRCSDEATGTDPNEDVDFGEVESVERFFQGRQCPDFVNATQRPAAGQRQSDRRLSHSLRDCARGAADAARPGAVS